MVAWLAMPVIQQLVASSHPRYVDAPHLTEDPNLASLREARRTPRETNMSDNILKFLRLGLNQKHGLSRPACCHAFVHNNAEAMCEGQLAETFQCPVAKRSAITSKTQIQEQRLKGIAFHLHPYKKGMKPDEALILVFLQSFRIEFTINMVRKANSVSSGNIIVDITGLGNTSERQISTASERPNMYWCHIYLQILQYYVREISQIFLSNKPEVRNAFEYYLTSHS
jgi:hypothetical protein